MRGAGGFVNIADKLKGAAETWYADMESYAALRARSEACLDNTEISVFALSFLGPEMSAAEKRELPPWGNKPAPGAIGVECVRVCGAAAAGFFHNFCYIDIDDN